MPRVFDDSVALVICISASEASSFFIKSGSKAGVKTLYFKVGALVSVIPKGLSIAGAAGFFAAASG